MNTLSIFNPLFAENVFDSLYRKTPEFSVSGSVSGCFYPAVDVREKSDSYIMDIDLPGYTEKDVTVHLKDRMLTLSSVQQETKEEKETDEQFLIKERSRRHFVRRFTLPEDIDHEKVEAAFKNGILTVSIPRKEAPARRQIEIKAS